MKYGTESLVMTEKNIFAYKLFLLLNISDFNFFFYVKICIHPPPPWKKPSPLSQQPPLKVEVLSSPPFWKFCFKSNPLPHPAEKEECILWGIPQFLTRENRLMFFIYFKPLWDFFWALPFLRSSDLDTTTMILRFRF